MFTVKKYEPSFYSQWNDCVSKSKNGTFLFHRDFMEYHSDRFEDYSLMIFDGEKSVAVFPANRKGTEVHSHQGLTYGGLIYSEKLRLSTVVEIFAELIRFLNSNGLPKLVIKCMPPIYHRFPSDEMEYALFLANARLIRRDALSVREQEAGLKIASNRMEGVKKGKVRGYEVLERNDFTAFWKYLLEPNLLLRHNAKPVHTLEEIMRLKAKFPKNIRLFTVEENGRPVAGTVLFETPKVVHAQYIASDERRNETGSVDFLFHHLITNTFADKKYFDFGSSNEEQGRKLNEGLAFWKESFGARTIVQDFYEVDTMAGRIMENFLI